MRGALGHSPQGGENGKKGEEEKRAGRVRPGRPGGPGDMTITWKGRSACSAKPYLLGKRRVGSNRTMLAVWLFR